MKKQRHRETFMTKVLPLLGMELTDIVLEGFKFNSATHDSLKMMLGIGDNSTRLNSDPEFIERTLDTMVTTKVGDVRVYSFFDTFIYFNEKQNVATVKSLQTLHQSDSGVTALGLSTTDHLLLLQKLLKKHKK